MPQFNRRDVPGSATSPVPGPTLTAFVPDREGDVLEFAFVSSIYVFDCGHSTAVRTTRPSELGDVQPCHECSADQPVVKVITLD
jgi:hypothetical protein